MMVESSKGTNADHQRSPAATDSRPVFLWVHVCSEAALWLPAYDSLAPCSTYRVLPPYDAGQQRCWWLRCTAGLIQHTDAWRLYAVQYIYPRSRRESCCFSAPIGERNSFIPRRTIERWPAGVWVVVWWWLAGQANEGHWAGQAVVVASGGCGPGAGEGPARAAGFSADLPVCRVTRRLGRPRSPG